MADSIQIPHHRKRKRRRQDKSSITARLVLDDHVKGDVGILSEDLFADLFPTKANGIGRTTGGRNKKIANEFQLKPTRMPRRIPKSIMLQSHHGDPLPLSKTQHGRSSRLDPLALLRIRQCNSPPLLLCSKGSLRPCRKSPLQNFRVTAEVGLRSGFWM